MASYTTPRTANVGDIWTAAWYNGEVRDDITWLHDGAVSRGSTFPTSPVTGQRHEFVAGVTQLLFTYDGTHWVSEEMVVPATVLAQYNAGAVGAALPAVQPLAFAGTNQSLRGFMGLIPTIDTLDTVQAHGMTLQGRISGECDRAGGTNGILAVGVATASAINTSFGTDAEVAATDVTITGGFYSGPWGDIASGSIAAVQLVLWLKANTGGSSLTFVSQSFHTRYKL